MWNLFKKRSKHRDYFDAFSSKLKRQARNHRYYVRHRAELREKRRERYFLTGE